ncbi:peptidoglycan-binding domain-containing protein [Oceanibium sediminis]|uniref:peptidoglycan-binding domain-containing protein n=1 Tax=Oceanibium sediminis TaxID=2026339 RepID=UPI001E5AECB5|nr:peptidoglycan-binding domain-containing protein [Oceanibium sediminis]
MPLASSVAAQSEPGSDDLAAVLDLLTDPVATAEEIGKQLTACLRPIYEDSLPHDDIVVLVSFGPDGQPGLPEFVEPDEEDTLRSHLRQFFRAETAIFDCAPLTSGGSIISDTELTLRVDDAGISIWDDGTADLPDDAASEQTEEALSLSRAERREIQQRLNLAGQDAGGADGVFGPRTRDALADWQEENGLPRTGYLNETQIEALKTQTEDAYAAYLKSRPARTQRNNNTGYYRGSDGCLRYRANNRIVPKQSFRCDAKGLVQSF